MKKLLALVLLAFSLCFVGCDTADIQVGSENGVAYFYTSTIVPKMVLSGEEEVEIENKAFFGALVDAIEEKPIRSIEEQACNCAPIYRVKIKDYTFILHSTHGIEIQKSVGKWIKAIEHIGIVECSQAEMEQLFELLAEGIS